MIIAAGFMENSKPRSGDSVKSILFFPEYNLGLFRRTPDN
jgi:hypothetical protein